MVDNRPLNVRTEYQHLPIDTLKQLQKTLSSEISVLLFNVRTDGNIGMIIRQSCIMGCKNVIICGRKHYDARFTVGAHNYINVIHWNKPLNISIKTISPGVFHETVEYNVDYFIEMCQGYTPVFLEQGGIDITTVSWKTLEHPPLLILGNESLGIPMQFIKTVKQQISVTLSVTIPQYSVLRSMNVAIAGSIALWEITKSFKDNNP